MDWKNFLEKISNVENSTDICKLKFLDFNPWPYIRLAILDKWTLENTASLDKETDQNGKSERIFLSLVKSFFVYIKNPIRRENVDIVYITHLTWFKEPLGSKVFDKIADSFWYFFSEDYKIKNLEISNYAWGNDELYFQKDVTSIYFLLLLIRIKYKIRSYLNVSKTLLFNDLNQEIKKHFGFEVDASAELAFINYLSNRFMKILSGYNPKLVFLAVFYCPNSMAIILACHRLGIRVVEYQHGAPNEYHPMTTHWDNIPHEGFELIPDIFWVWGHSSKKIIDKWSEKSIKHKAIVGGNLWMTFVRQRPASVDKNRRALFYDKNKTNILVTMQGDQFFPDFIFESIEQNSGQLIWHFRNHPTLHISGKLEDKISSYANTEIDYSSQAPLYDLLEVTDLHITSFSTVAFEAQCFDIETIFTHVIALNGYRAFINGNGLYYADTSNTMDILIEKLLSGGGKIQPDHIISSLTVHKSALSKLMEVN